MDDPAQLVETADLAGVIAQAHALLGAPAAEVAGDRNGILARLHLRIAGWSLGIWNLDDGRPGALTDAPGDDVGVAWLADTGHLLWFTVDGTSAMVTAAVADTPRSFHGCVCERADVGEAVWEHVLARVPLIGACPLGFDAWSERAPRRDHRGGPTLLADLATRGLDEMLAAQLRKVADPRQGRAEQTSFSWATDDDEYRIAGVFAATATARPYPAGAVIATDDIKHFLFVSTIGTWLSYGSHVDDIVTIREFDTVRDLYRFQIAGRPDDDVFRQMWNNLAARHPIARDAELNPLARWTAAPQDLAPPPETATGGTP